MDFLTLKKKIKKETQNRISPYFILIWKQYLEHSIKIEAATEPLQRMTKCDSDIIKLAHQFQKSKF